MRTFTHQLAHHTADSQQTDQFAKIDADHKARGWGGIGYNRFIERSGQLVYGRPLNKVGAHTINENGPRDRKNKLLNLNEVGIGYCLAGDFTKELPTPEQIKTLHDVALMDAWTFGIPLENRLLHWQVKPTQCPGVDLWEMVAEYHKEYLKERLQKAENATRWASGLRYAILIRLIKRIKNILSPK